MPTQISFDNALIADAIMKAARIAPSKGAEFDKAQGILIKAYPGDQYVVIQSTNLSVHYTQRVPAIAGSGSPTEWRLPSRIVADYMAAIPKKGDSTIDFICRDDGKLRLRTGQSFASFNLIVTDDYPKFPQFTSLALSEAQQLASRVDQVAWACDTGSPILKGIHIDGHNLVACSREGLAIIPCEVPIAEAVTVPLVTLAGLLKTASDVRLAADANKLYIALDAETQTSAQLLDGDYPVYKGLLRDNFTGSFTAHRGSFLEALNNLIALVKSERLPILSLSVDGAESLLPTVTMNMEVPGVGRMQETINIEREYDGPPLTFRLKYGMLQSAIEKCKGDKVKIKFGNSDDPLRSVVSPLQIEDNHSFVSVIMCMKPE